MPYAGSVTITKDLATIFLTGPIVHLPIISPSNITIVAAGVSNKCFVVFDYHISTSDPTILKWKSGTTDISGPLSFGPKDKLVVPCNPRGVLITNPGEPLVLYSSGTGIVGGALTGAYVDKDT